MDDDYINLVNECPYGVIEVKFQSIIWAPKLGQRLGKSSTPPCTQRQVLMMGYE
jgi:hypothetical protein